MDKLMAGFGRIDITPPMGTWINGYFIKRVAEGILDPLEAGCIALTQSDTTVLLMSLDNLGIPTVLMDPLRQVISQATGVAVTGIYIHCTHSHTAGAVGTKWEGPLELAYREILRDKLVEVAKAALADRKPARMGWRTVDATGISFSRRFRMKDGSVRTNPGIGNPDIADYLGIPDRQLRLLRFDREGADTLVLIQFGMHPDTVGGCKLSADWPGFVRRTFEQAIPDAKVVFFNGAQGDVGTQNVFPEKGDMNHLTLDFDDVYRGYGATCRLGRFLAGAALQIYDVVRYEDAPKLTCAQTTVRVPANVPTPDQLPLARKYADLHNADRDDLIPFTGMQLTTVVAEALRMVRLADGPEYFEMYLSAVGIGPVALLGIPGEPFAGVSHSLQGTPGWENVIVTCNTNGYEGYFPMQEAYDEGGYESRSSAFKPGVAELLVRESQNLLRQL